ncbi:HTH-type transcriptional activator IlvY [Ferrimonas gelatinilytica]|uniref:HTH-type transcriptional activator IlvY n=1 Tax=Ferrimonas gelatinilytica TaxID=1255257 RepID=A0ABP9RVN5_9GAMM
MDTRSLQLFTHLAQSLHFGQTARANHLSPSALSRAIQRLEQELGTPLLQRDNRSVSLTPAGERFAEFARVQLNQWQQFRDTLSPVEQTLRGSLKIYCSVTAAYSHLPQVLDPFRQAHPEVEIQLTTGDAAGALSQLSAQQADVAITASDGPPPASFQITTLDQIAVAIIAPTIPCAVQRQLDRPQIDWQQLPLIVPEHGQTRQRLTHWYRSKGVSKPRIYATVAGHEALISMVALGCGVGIAPLVALEHSPMKSRIRHLSAPGEIPPFLLGIGCLSKRRQEPIIAALLAAAGSVTTGL